MKLAITIAGIAARLAAARAARAREQAIRASLDALAERARLRASQSAQPPGEGPAKTTRVGTTTTPGS